MFCVKNVIIVINISKGIKLFQKILLTGFFGEGNLGDEAILKAICENLPKEITPIITSGSKHSFGKDIRRRGILSIIPYLKATYQSPVTLFAGGILQDWSWEGVTFFANRIITAAKIGSTPILFGAGIGPLRSEKAKRLVKKALSFVKIAYVRDKTSYDLYKSLLPNANVELGTDWTWHFPIKKIKGMNESVLGVNLRQWNNTELLRKAALQIDSFHGKKIGLVARKNDEYAIYRTFNTVDLKNIADFSECASMCDNFSHGIAMRYHVALAMLRSGLPTKLVCYDDKVKDLAFSNGLKIDENSISFGYEKATDVFLKRNEQLFSKMKTAFLKILEEKYDIMNQ